METKTEGKYLSRSFACIECGFAIHDSVEPLVMIDTISVPDGFDMDSKGPYHEACAKRIIEEGKGN